MIVITGASDGLGLQLAKLYAESGKKVVNISRRPSKYAYVNIEVDLREESAYEEVASRISQMSEELEAIIYNAGVMSIQTLGMITEDEVRRVMSTNIHSQILLTSLLVERILKDQTDIVCVASTVGTKAYIDQAVYGASKWAVRGFVKNLQEEFKSVPNRVISFCPGGFKSEIAKKATGNELPLKGGSMEPADLAMFIKQILDLPKNMEVSEVIINRKAIN